jgi:hypothetical protein
MAKGAADLLCAGYDFRSKINAGKFSAPPARNVRNRDCK